MVGVLLGSAAGLVGVQVNALGPFQGVSMLLVGLSFLTALLWKDRAPLARVRLTSLDYSFLLLLIAWGMLELVNSGELRHSPFIGVLLTVGVAYAATFPVRMVVRAPSDLAPFLRGFSAPGVLVALIAIAQLLRVPGVNEVLVQITSSGGLAERLSSGWDIRGTSTIGHWTALGGYLACVIAASCVDLIISSAGTKLAPWPVAALTVLFAGAVTTLTFATIGAAAVILALTALRLKARPVLVLSGAAVLAAGWLVLGQSIAARLEQQSGQSQYAIAQYSWLPQTIGYRVNIWVTETLPAIAERPLSGWGTQVYSAVDKGWPVRPSSLVWVSPESEWMRTLIASGVLGLLPEVLLLLVAFAVVLRSRRMLGAAAVFPVTILLVVLVVISTIHSHFSNPGVPLALWPLVFAVAVAARRAKTPPVPPSSKAESPKRRRQHLPR
ncbi:O-antigen ligase family protein [Rathayibacter sp. AY2B9]|uniref:O-antigen ligase family protein n=1 Tax=Rathayibacter sp. AY2B9 TaxID=2080572 RepID=UPI0015E386F7|nr:O-antigen ligase family protein [Rathayibacter sp. AY2B9]